MKYLKLFNLLGVMLALSLGAGGCKKKPIGPTPIPGYTGGIKNANETSGPITGAPPIATEQNPITKPLPGGELIPLGGGRPLSDYNPNPDRFAANTVYFDLDRATIKPSETSKIDEVARYLQGNPTHAVQVEGHCDERGTEQYNLSLGERRALSVREVLVTSGIQADRVFTISYGESRPAQTGHNEAAWSKNRRGVFVLLTPK